MSQELPNDSQAMAVALVGPNRRVLELGCGAGHVTKQLVAGGCHVTGIEIDPDAAAVASTFAQEVHVADLDATEPAAVLGDSRFERIVVGDVFEHLKDPGSTLSALRSHLSDDGLLIASIPNVTHADVRLMLLDGQWRYQDLGLLDRTHLRFFDLAGITALFGESGWHIERLERTNKDVLASELGDLAAPASRKPGVLDAIKGTPDATTYQFVVVASVGEPTPGADERFADPSATGRTPSPVGTGDTDERLLAENAQLRVKVRELEEMLEDFHWSRAAWRQRFGRITEPPKRSTADTAGGHTELIPGVVDSCSEGTQILRHSRDLVQVDANLIKAAHLTERTIAASRVDEPLPQRPVHGISEFLRGISYPFHSTRAHQESGHVIEVAGTLLGFRRCTQGNGHGFHRHQAGGTGHEALDRTQQGTSLLIDH